MAAATSLTSKALSLFGSIRFWQIVAGAAAKAASEAGALPDWAGNIIAIVFGSSVAVGTVDKATEGTRPQRRGRGR